MSEKDKKDIKKEKETDMQKSLVEQVGESGEELEEDGSNVATLPMIPLRGLTIFPNMVLHFDIGREKSINALEKAMI
ncbi:MAG: LON peptidase substrate-binding domain-containing protein, partial [Anaerovoracaceae bacterium]